MAQVGRVRQSIDYEFIAPLIGVYNSTNKYKYKCKTISDLEFLESGIGRCMENIMSGREWMQLQQDLQIAQLAVSQYMEIKDEIAQCGVNNFFSALKSDRRLKLLKLLATMLTDEYKNNKINDPFKNFPELDNFAIYAGDGHSHKASEHENKVDGKKYAPCHLYMVNLRTNLATHMDVARPKSKKEHEISMLQRIGGPGLRMGEPTKTKVIIIYDKAIVDYSSWHNWKFGSGVYIVSESKCNMAKLKCSINDVDMTNPINAGVLSSQNVGIGKGLLVRVIKYKDPDEGTIHEFVTTELNVEPGLICFMYKMRWIIEKIFDQFKNSFYEQKAWAKSDIAKSIQANFICLTHNLISILQDVLEEEEGCTEEKILRRRDMEIGKLQEKCKKQNIAINPMLLEVRRPPQVTKQLIRWLRVAIFHKTSWELFVERSRVLMSEYIL